VGLVMDPWKYTVRAISLYAIMLEGKGAGCLNCDAVAIAVRGDGQARSVSESSRRSCISIARRCK